MAAAAAALLMCALVAACSPEETAPTPTPSSAPPTPTPEPATPPEFAAVSGLINDAIAAERMPGAVVMVGHGGTVVFEHAYGARKLAGEPGLDGTPAPAEPMTADTIFDIASLTKPLATATAVLQLHEQGTVDLDDPVQRYLPEFNPAGDPQRAAVTVRMLLTHTSGEPVDVALADPWGLGGADKPEGMHRALTTPLEAAPGRGFHYSDINFIVLGALLETITGEVEDVYVQRQIFAPLGMADTGYLPPAKACGPHTMRGPAISWAPAPKTGVPETCPAGTWRTDVLSRIAPTARDEDNMTDPQQNPNFYRLLRGAVHDPTTRRMGGVAGNAGVFATAHDVAVYAQALLDRLAGRPSRFPLERETLELMTTPQQPGHTAGQLDAAGAAAREALAATPHREDPLLAPSYPAIAGQNLFGFGWDIDTAYSLPRGAIFPIGSFGNTGFTGTSLWIDPSSDTYVVFLTNAIHVRGSTPISDLRGEVATLAAQAVGL
jgi:CubicO group peptidase (beta-lactamase class C family)